MHAGNDTALALRVFPATQDEQQGTRGRRTAIAVAQTACRAGQRERARACSARCSRLHCSGRRAPQPPPIADKKQRAKLH